MAEGIDPGAPGDIATGAVGHHLTVMARWMALAGGLVLVGILVLVVVSVVGRKLFAVPVPGDVELTSVTAAVASAWFFPWCFAVSGDVKVDFFTNRWSRRSIATLEAVGALLVTVLAATIAWRTSVAAVSIHEFGEISAILGVPTWISYAGMVPGFALLALLGLDRFVQELRVAMGFITPAGSR